MRLSECKTVDVSIGDLLTSRTVGTRWYHRFFVVEDINIETGDLSIMFLDTGAKDTISNLSIYKLVSFGKFTPRKDGLQWIKSGWMMKQ